jgi:hypothetical protein
MNNVVLVNEERKEKHMRKLRKCRPEQKSSEEKQNPYLHFVEYMCGKNIEYPSLQCAWIWYNLSCYDRIEYVEVLKGNSCNALFTTLKCFYEENGIVKDIPIFAKIQVNKEKDNILIDNINGFIINNLEKTSKCPNFMKYIDSTLTMICLSEDGKYRLPLREMGYSNTKKVIEGAKDRMFCPMSLNVAIQTEQSLGDFLYDTNLNAKILIQGIRKLFYHLCVVGSKYGFCHNDAHPGNILIKDNNVFVLIDYGRAFFTEHLLPKDVRDGLQNKYIEEHLKFENVHGCDIDMNKIKGYYDVVSGSTAYRNYNHIGTRVFIGNYQQKWTNTYDKLYMFDILTITLHLLRGLYFPENKTLYSYLKDILVNFMYDFETEDEPQHYITMASHEQVKTFIKRDDIHMSSFKVFLPGIYWFSFVVHILIEYGKILERIRNKSESIQNTINYIQDSISTNDQDNTVLVDIRLLHQARIISHHYQIINIPNVSFIQFYIAKETDEYSIIQNILLNKSPDDKKTFTEVPPKKRTIKELSVRSVSGKKHKELMGGYVPDMCPLDDEFMVDDYDLIKQVDYLVQTGQFIPSRG